jgi:hypothetical protein
MSAAAVREVVPAPAAPLRASAVRPGGASGLRRLTLATLLAAALPGRDPGSPSRPTGPAT